MTALAAEIVETPKADEGRRGDGLLLIAQDNQRRQLLIEAVNEAALNRLGYREEEIKERKLEVVLGHESALILEEELEYDEHSPDLADVLSRQRELRFRLRSGKEIAVACRINRLLAENRQHRFQLIIPNDREAKARQQLREFLKINLEGHQQLEPATGLPDRPSFDAFIGRVKGFSAESPMEVALAVLRVDRWEKSIARYGEQACKKLVQHVATVCKNTLRSEDVVAGMEDRLGLMLIDISRDSARVVLNRLRWNIRSHTIDFGGKSDFSITVSLAFTMLSEENSARILSDCEAAVGKLEDDTRNALIELAE